MMDNGTNVTMDDSINITVSVDPDEMEMYLIPRFAKTIYGDYYEYNFPITFVICIVGLVTNGLNIVVFTRKNMINSVNFFLAALSVADIFLISSQFPYTVHYLFKFKSLFKYAWVEGYIFLICVEAFSIMTCNWLAVTIGIWRFLAINWPLRSREWCSMSRAKKILVLLIVIGLFVSVPIAFLLKVDAYPMFGKILYSKGYSDLAKIDNSIFLKLLWGGLLLITFLPCVLLVIINFLLVRSLIVFRRERTKTFIEQPRDGERQIRSNNRTTAMLTVLLVLFVVNSLPDSALVLASFFDLGDQKFKLKARNATDFLRVFNTVNNSVSFFVYYFMGENFRSTFKSVFCGQSARNARVGVSGKTSTGTNSTEIYNISPNRLTQNENDLQDGSVL